MIVHDVVCVIHPWALTDRPIGRWHVAGFDLEPLAVMEAARLNHRWQNPPGVEYRVETWDAADERRAVVEQDADWLVGAN